MKEKMTAGYVAYIVGFFGAILVGLLAGANVFDWTSNMWVPMLLILAGVVIGLLNITRNEKVPIMIASIILGLGSGVFATLDFIGGYLEAILIALAAVYGAVAVVVAITVAMNKSK